MQLKDSSFIITGGASGLGEASVRLFHAAGAKLLIADMNRERGAALAEELGANVRFCAVDVSNETDVATSIDDCISAFGGLHGVINCAGVAPGERLVGKEQPHQLSSFMRAVNINLVGSFNYLRLAATAMGQRAANSEGERGIIINTASIAGYDGQIGQVAYAATKAGVIGMTLPAARELAKFGIRVVTIAPGLFSTPLMQTLPEQVQADLAASIPFPHRLGRSAEFAALAQHIVENVMINGETIRLDGAIRLAPR